MVSRRKRKVERDRDLRGLRCRGSWEKWESMQHSFGVWGGRCTWLACRGYAEERESGSLSESLSEEEEEREASVNQEGEEAHGLKADDRRGDWRGWERRGEGGSREINRHKSFPLKSLVSSSPLSSKPLQTGKDCEDATQNINPPKTLPRERR